VVTGGLCLSDSFCHAEFPKVEVSSNNVEQILGSAGNTIGKTPPNPVALAPELPDSPSLVRRVARVRQDTPDGFA
jgi:hypothetical protein